ncbi:MAG: glutaredoxin family protein [Fimbriimonadaceae bacterium]
MSIVDRKISSAKGSAIQPESIAIILIAMILFLSWMTRPNLNNFTLELTALAGRTTVDQELQNALLSKGMKIELTDYLEADGNSKLSLNINGSSKIVAEGGSTLDVSKKLLSGILSAEKKILIALIGVGLTLLITSMIGIGIERFMTSFLMMGIGGITMMLGNSGDINLKAIAVTQVSAVALFAAISVLKMINNKSHWSNICFASGCCYLIFSMQSNFGNISNVVLFSSFHLLTMWDGKLPVTKRPIALASRALVSVLVAIPYQEASNTNIGAEGLIGTKANWLASPVKKAHVVVLTREGCGACLTMKRELDRRKISIDEIDIDMLPELNKKYSIATPTFLVVDRDLTILDVKVGWPSSEEDGGSFAEKIRIGSFNDSVRKNNEK